MNLSLRKLLGNYLKITLSRRIASGYMLILLMAISATIVSFWQFQKNRNIYQSIIKRDYPAILYMNDMKHILTFSGNLIMDYSLFGQEDEHTKLRILYESEFPVVKFKLEEFAHTNNDATFKNNISTLFLDFETLYYYHNLIKFYISRKPANTDTLVGPGIEVIRNNLSALIDRDTEVLSRMLLIKSNELEFMEAGMEISYRYLVTISMLLLFLILMIGALVFYFTTSLISKPIKSLKRTIFRLAEGELPDVRHTSRKDEIGDIINAIVEMVESIKVKSEFAGETGRGNYQAQLKLESENDMLGNALIRMRDNLKRVAEEDGRRNWINEGLSRANELLRISGESNNHIYSNITALWRNM